jgi:hypothetical protein
MKRRTLVLLSLIAAACLPSCAYTIPGGGQSVLADVTDAIPGQPVVNSHLMGATPSSAGHAQARAQQSDAFWGGAR